MRFDNKRRKPSGLQVFSALAQKLSLGLTSLIPRGDAFTKSPNL
jgi:hypothetical protein